MPPELPSTDTISAWLRGHVRKPKLGLLARCLGADPEFHYDVATPQRRRSTFFERHVLCTVFGEHGLLPGSSLPGGSWGVFAWDGSALHLLAPGDDSFARVLRAEDKPLAAADADELAQLISDVLLGRKPACGHTVVSDRAALANFGDKAFRKGAYIADLPVLDRIASAIVAPRIDPQADGGWLLQFTTAWGWMHRRGEVGVETIRIGADYALEVLPRRVLAPKIFRKLPELRY
jgi:hypothetical protein